MDIVGIIVGTVNIALSINNAFACLGGKHEHFRLLSDNWSKLTHEVELLNDVERILDSRLEREELKQVAVIWIKNAKHMRERFNVLQGEIGKVGKYFKNPLNHEGIHSHDDTRRRFRKYLKVKGYLYKTWHSSRLVRLSKDMEDLFNDIRRINPENIDTLFTERNSSVEPEQQVNPFPSLKKHVEKVITFLKSEEERKIGIYGESGMGKTTILDIVKNEKFITDNFIVVVTVSVERHHDEIPEVMLRNSIIKQLKMFGLISEDDACRSNAEVDGQTLISEKLQETKYLILVDQVTSNIDLEKLGISDNHKLGKVVVATREKTVFGKMGITNWFRVHKLESGEALDLFFQTVGSIRNEENISPVAGLIVNLCGGQPRLIKALAKNLSENISEPHWRAYLKEMQSASRLKNANALGRVFKYVYDKLDDRKKKLMMYGAMFPADHEIHVDYLTEYYRAQEPCRTDEEMSSRRKSCLLKTARHEGEENLEKLEAGFLLDRCSNEKHVKIPFCFRKWALMMATPGSCFVETGSDQNNNKFKENDWRRAETISLMYSTNQSKLPKIRKQNNISVLFLQGNQSLNRISKRFLCRMTKLQVLDLRATGINSLPNTLSKLINLRALYLCDCRDVQNLPFKTKKLNNLEVLDVRGTGISYHSLPIQNLQSLRCLRVTFSNPVVKDNEVEDFEKLTSLEEFSLEVPDKKLDDVDDYVLKEVVKKVVNMNTLSLTTLSFTSPFFNELETFIKEVTIIPADIKPIVTTSWGRQRQRLPELKTLIIHRGQMSSSPPPHNHVNIERTLTIDKHTVERADNGISQEEELRQKKGKNVVEYDTRDQGTCTGTEKKPKVIMFDAIEAIRSNSKRKGKEEWTEKAYQEDFR